MAKRVEICEGCDEMFQVDYITGEGDCPVCNVDCQDSREVEYTDGNLRYMDKNVVEPNDYCDEEWEEAEAIPEVKDIEYDPLQDDHPFYD